MRLRILLSLSLAVQCIIASAYTVVSPDGKTVLETSVKDGSPVYKVSHEGIVMIEESPLGLATDVCVFGGNIVSVKDSVSPYHVNFKQDRIKTSQVDFQALRLVSDYKTSDGNAFSVEWLVGDNDVAFRYLIPRQGKKEETGSMVIKQEYTGFRLPERTTTFITPQSDPMIGWKRSKPSYEEEYTNDAPMTEPSQFGRGYTFPALFRIGDDGWVLLSETGVDGGYCASHLSDFTDGVYTVAYPMPEENNGNGSASPGIALPGTTPWRTITLGKTLAPIAETVIPWAPLRPLYGQDEVFSDSKGTWSWIIWQDNSMNYDDQVTFIDLAADMKYGHILIDAGWDKNIGKERMEDLISYAHSKGVMPMLWYSSSGWWNDIVQSPINIMSRPIPRKEEMKWLKKMGVRAIKVDFFGGDKQETIRLYEDILSDASDYGISVIFHGCTLPRGWERMYPNYIGSEAVLASENLVFSQDFCDHEAFNATLHPFIRNTVGCMEYGGTVLNHRLGRGNRRGNIRRTSDGFQLATSILFQNPVQNFALTPEAYAEAPAEAIEFMKNVPTTWDETRFIDGYPGIYAVIARRHGDTWYIAGVFNGDNDKDEKTITIDSSIFNGCDEADLYTDAGQDKLHCSRLKVNGKKTLELKLSHNHGFVIVAGR